MAPGFKSGGRKAGTPNKKSKQMKEAVQRLLEDADRALAEKGLKLFEGDAHGLLKMVYKHPELDLAMRVDAAKAAARFEKPSLAATAVDLAVSSAPIHRWSDAQLHEFIAQERARLGLPAPNGQPLTIDGDCVENPSPKSTQ
jgi:hypothetical protein